jgi:hypothetical protein
LFLLGFSSHVPEDLSPIYSPSKNVTKINRDPLKKAAEHGFATVALEYSGSQGLELPEEENIPA